MFIVLPLRVVVGCSGYSDSTNTSNFSNATLNSAIAVSRACTVCTNCDALRLRGLFWRSIAALFAVSIALDIVLFSFALFALFTLNTQTIVYFRPNANEKPK